MTKGFFVKTFDKFMAGEIDLLDDTIKVTLVDAADYTVDLAAHDFINDVPGGARVATATLAGKSLTNGVFDATNTDLGNVSGDESEAFVIWKDTGNEATSALIWYDDEADGLPVIPNGGPLLFAWDDGANKIFTFKNEA